MLLEKRKGRTVAIPTSSMADIAFLLLTFFLVTTSLDVDKGLLLPLPPKGGEIKIRPENIASLLINDAGGVMLDEKEIEINQIKDEIKRRLIQRPKLIVSIKTGRSTKYQAFISVLDQVQMAECQRISIAEPEM